MCFGSGFMAAWTTSCVLCVLVCVPAAEERWRIRLSQLLVFCILLFLYIYPYISPLLPWLLLTTIYIHHQYTHTKKLLCSGYWSDDESRIIHVNYDYFHPSSGFHIDTTFCPLSAVSDVGSGLERVAQKRKVPSPSQSSNGHSSAETTPSPSKKKRKPGPLGGNKDQVAPLPNTLSLLYMPSWSGVSMLNCKWQCID